MKTTAICAILLCGAICFSSCKKSSTPSPVNKFTDIQASATFNWSTSQKVNFQVVGLGNVATEKNMLKVMSSDGKSVYYTQFVSMNANVNTHFSVPRGITSILVTYGSIQKTVAITSGAATFNYTQDLTN